MPNTPILALPYPAPTDPVAQGAANIRSLAESLEAYEAVVASKKLTANGTLLTLPAGSFPSKYAAIEISAYMFQSTVAATSERITWGFRPFPAVGSIGYGLVGNAGSGSPGMGQAQVAGAVTLSSFLAHTSARQNSYMAFFHAIIYGYAEPRAHLMTFDWFSLADFSGNATSDWGHGSGRAHMTVDNVRAQGAVTGFELFANGSGFGVDSVITARGLGARLAGFTSLLPSLPDAPDRAEQLPDLLPDLPPGDEG